MFYLARLYPFTPHNRRRQLRAPATSAGFLKHYCLDSTLKNGNRSTNNALQSRWHPRRLAAPCLLDQALMRSSAFRVVTFRWTQDRQEWQSPDRFCQRNLDQQHAAEPTQATGFDKVRVRRSNRVAVDPLALILAPRRLSIVSSIPKTSSPFGAKVATNKRSRIWLAAKTDHRARFKTR
jgi:hypothetical protein